MLWKILGVVLGYVVTAVFVFMTFSAFYLAIGANGAYYPGTYDVSVFWITVSSLLGLVAAVLGGYVCKRISGSAGAVKVLAGIILSLGILVAVVQAFAVAPPREVRTSEVTDYEAMRKSRQPVWLGFVNPVIGFAGILIGGSVGKRSKEEED